MVDASATIRPESPILLGSASPRRRDILQGLGLPFVVRPADVDEALRSDDNPETYLARVVSDKLCAAEAKQEQGESFSCVLVADTIVVLDDAILGKPADPESACALVTSLCGRTHRVFTRFAFSAPAAASRQQWARTVESSVTMRGASLKEIRRYAQTGEGADKAGGYAVQGLGAFLVSRIDGSFTNVVGLPACELIQQFTRVGLLTDFPLLG